MCDIITDAVLTIMLLLLWKKVAIVGGAEFLTIDISIAQY